jgi:ubiquitin-protein ligase
MRESPRLRRLRSDYRAMEKLRAESSIIDFVATGDPPETYSVRFRGKGVFRPSTSDGAIAIREHHEVSIQLGASYPRMMPELGWKTPIFHPNISASGIVCLGGYGTHWVPSVSLAELCHMLWDMIRYKNFDVESPYNREAAAWTKEQLHYQLPLDRRPLRDRLAGMSPPEIPRGQSAIASSNSSYDVTSEVTFLEPEILEAEIVEAEIVESPVQDILFIE